MPEARGSPRPRTVAPREPARSYEVVAPVYDWIARIGSLGRVERARRWLCDWVQAGDRCLFVGVGTGIDALWAARRGADVTALDLSPRMLAATERRLSREGHAVRLVQGDLFDAPFASDFDVVAAPFVLDVMGPDAMRRALARLAAQLRPGGRLLLADFAPPRGGPAARLVVRAHFALLCGVGALLGLATYHAPYDHEQELAALGLPVHAREGFALWPGGPDLYEAVVAERAA